MSRSSAKSQELADFRFADGQTLGDKILSALIAIAPTGKDQATLSELFNEATKEGGLGQGGRVEALITMLHACHDGIHYGNWPWVK